MEKTAEQICHHCGVPNDLHGTCCGWENAAAPCNANMVITDTRHPGFGQPLNLWKNTDVDILSDDGFDISAKVGYRSGWNDATAHLQSTIDQLKQENERLKSAGWISVKERLPELTEQVYWYNDDNERVPWEGRFEATVLAYDPEIGHFKAKFDTQLGWREIGKSYINGTVKPTHWMPLPNSPSK